MFYNTIKNCFLSLCLLFSPQLLATSQSIKPFEATYTVKYRGMSVAKATRTLKIDNTGHYLFTLNTRSTVPLIKFKNFETSKGTWFQSGPHPDEYVFTGAISNDLGAVAGSYDVLLAAWDDNVGNHVFKETAANH